MRLIRGEKFLVSDLRKLYAIEVGKDMRLITETKSPILTLRLNGDRYCAATADEILVGESKTGAIIKRVPYTLPADTDIGLYGERVLLFQSGQVSWLDAPGTPIATLDRPIVNLYPTDGGLVLTLDGNSGVVYLRLDRERATVHHIGTAVVTVNPSFVLVESGDGLTRVSIPSLAKASLPVVRRPNRTWVDVSPSGMQLLEVAIREWWLWSLPQLSSDVIAEARATTNLVETSTSVVWPWQETTSGAP